jgi:hypothetical protein
MIKKPNRTESLGFEISLSHTQCRARKYMVEREERERDYVQLCHRDLGNQRFENTDPLISWTISTDGKTRSKTEN